MQYVQRFSDTETITATGQTTYSAWFDVDWANEMYSWVQFAESETGNSETVDVTLERYVAHSGVSNQTVITHTQLAAAGTEEKFASALSYDGDAAIGADQKLGGRVRYKYVSGGAFASDQSITITVMLEVYRR